MERKLSQNRNGTYQFRNRSRNVNIAEGDEEEITEDPSDEEEDREAHISNGRTRGNQGRNSAAPRSRKPWPEGKTIDGYTFSRDDSVSSPRPPPGVCYICTGPKHFARDCSHYGK